MQHCMFVMFHQGRQSYVMKQHPAQKTAAGSQDDKHISLICKGKQESVGGNHMQGCRARTWLRRVGEGGGCGQGGGGLGGIGC